MAELNFPNIAGNFQSGYAFGTKMRDDRQAQQDNAALRGLAPQIIAGDPNAYSQAAAIDPQAAGQYQQAGNSQLRKLKGYVDFVENARASGNIQAVNAALREGAPLISSITGKPGPTEWTEDMDPGWQQLKARVAMADFGVGKEQRNLSVSPGSAIVDPATGQVVYERPYTPSNQTINVAGPDGRPVQYTFNTRTGTYEPAALSGQPATPVTRQISGFNANVQNMGDGSAMDFSNLPPEEQAAFIQSLQSGQPVNLPPAGGGAVGGGNTNPFVGRSPEEQAALTTRAQEEARLAVLPQQEAIQTDAAINRAREEARIKSEADLAGKDLTRQRSADDTLNLLTQAEQLIPISTGSGAGSLADESAAFFGGSNKGAEAIAALKTISGQLVAKMPRMEGPQSDKDVQMYKDMAGNLSDPATPRAQRLAALQMIRALNERYSSQAAPAPNQPQAPRMNRPPQQPNYTADDPLGIF